MNTAEYKKRLEEEKAVLEAELASVGRKTGQNGDDFEATEGNDFDATDADPNVAADALTAYDENRALTNALEPRLYDVHLALEKIQDGTYGTCEISGEEIEEARLDADPAARTCKAHMSEEEALPRG